MTSTSMLDRLARATTATVVGSAICVVVVTAAFADRLARAREDRSLLDAARTFATELLEPGAVATEVAIDEAIELGHTGIRLAIYDGDRFVAGDRSVRWVEVGCGAAGRFRACGAAAGRFVAVAGRPDDVLREPRDTVIVAGSIAGLLTAIVGALLARRVATVLVAPLTRLGTAVARVPEDALEHAELGTDEGVAEIDALRAALGETLGRLGHALATSRRFASDAAHELRTPLTTIVGELTLQADLLDGEAAATNDRVRRIAARMVTLIDRLLVLASPVTRAHAVESVDLQDAHEDALESLPLDAWERIQLDARPGVVVQGDPVLLSTMLSNGLENALKFSTGTVHVTIRSDGPEALVAIADDGPGVPTDERERVFAPFYRTRAMRAGAAPGHGIGLALIAHVVAIHGGHVRFADTSRGARLEIRLPVSAP